MLQDGLRKGIRSLLRLSRFVLPTVFLLNLFQHTSAFLRLADLCAPLTAPLGLPGTAALLLLTGLLINKWAGVTGLLLLPLSPEQLFTAAVFLSLAHNVVVELLMVWQSRLPAVRIALLRTAIAYAAACLTHLVLGATDWLSPLPLALQQTAPAMPDTTPIWLQAAAEALSAVGTLALFLLPLFVLLEALQRLALMPRLERFAAPLTRSLGLSPSLTPALLGGLLLGVATGAGVIEQALREEEHSQEELWKLNLFLLLFHSVFEDTLMFLLFPVPLLAIALVRFLVAWLACRLVFIK